MNSVVRMDDSLLLAQQLVDAIESGDTVKSDELLKAMQDGRFETLFQSVGQLTRELHDTLRNLATDERLTAMVQQDMPDACDRLNYVIEKTDQAANRTLSAVETMLPQADALAAEAQHLREQLAASDDLDTLRTNFRNFLDEVDDHGRSLRTGLTDVLLAQEYQDLTGQVIRRTITLVNQVEERLVGLVRACSVFGGNHEIVEETAIAVGQSHGPAIQAGAETVSEQADVDALLADLGF